MKKLILIFTVLSLFIVGCEDKKKEPEKKEDKNEIKKEEKNDYFVEITATKFRDLIKSEKKQLFFVGRDTCPACKTFKPIAEKYSKEKEFNIYYVNSTNFDENDWNLIDEVAVIEYIPTLLITTNEEVIFNEHGVKSYDELDNIITKYMK